MEQTIIPNVDYKWYYLLMNRLKDKKMKKIILAPVGVLSNLYIEIDN